MLAACGATADECRKLVSPTRADWLRFLWLGPVGTALMAVFVFIASATIELRSK